MNILIKESQPLTAFGINQILENEFEQINVSLAQDIDDVMSLFNGHQYDMFIIDTDAHLQDTASLIKIIKEKNAEAKILIYGNSNSVKYELNYIHMGACGFISKNSKVK